jgi:hypothetical protein
MRGITTKVRTNSAEYRYLMGELTVGSGSLFWVPRTDLSRHAPWQFDRLERLNFGAGEGNRTLVLSLGS